jgi:hypothetical protein
MRCPIEVEQGLHASRSHDWSGGDRGRVSRTVYARRQTS